MAKTVTIVLVNEDGRILLQLRDNTPEIPYPDHWTTFGGYMEDEETPQECIEREMQEELDIEMSEPEFITRHETCRGHDESVFRADIDIDKEKIEVKEGQKGRLFAIEEAKELDNIVCDAIEAIEAYQSKSSS